MQTLVTEENATINYFGLVSFIWKWEADGEPSTRLPLLNVHMCEQTSCRFISFHARVNHAHVLQRTNAENNCTGQLQRTTAENSCRDVLQRTAAEINCSGFASLSQLV